MGYAFAFVMGLAITVLEFAAVRLAAPYFGQSQLVWANVVSVVLLALACGSALGGRLAEIRADGVMLGRVAILAGLLALPAPLFGPSFDRFLLPEGFQGGPELSFAFLGSLASTLVLFGPPFVLLGAATPVLLRTVGPNGPVGRAAGLVLATSTLGSVLGCYLTALVFVPTLGTRRTLIATAAFLLAIGSVLAFARAASRRSSVVASVIVLVVPAVIAKLPELPAKGPGLPGDTVLFEQDSAMQLVRVLERREVRPGDDGESPIVRVLALDEGDAEYHSIYYPPRREHAGEAPRVDSGGRYYDALAAVPELLTLEPDAKVRVLVVGFAAGTAYRVLHHVLGDRLELVGIEIDPRVLVAAERHMGLDVHAPGLKCVVADGRAYVNALLPVPQFDLVFVDAYAHQQYVPFQVATVEFFAKLKAILSVDGILAINLDSRTAAARLPRVIAATVAAAGFASTSSLPIPGFPSALLLARNGESRPFLPLARAKHPFERVTDEWWRGLIGMPDTPHEIVLRDDLAPIERIIDESLMRTDRTTEGEAR